MRNINKFKALLIFILLFGYSGESFSESISLQRESLSDAIRQFGWSDNKSAAEFFLSEFLEKREEKVKDLSQVYALLKLKERGLDLDLPMDFDFDFGYVGLKDTMPDDLNFFGIEDDVSEGFLANETIRSAYYFHPMWGAIGQLTIFEKFYAQREKDEPILEGIEGYDPFTRTFTNTLNYGLGVTWKKNLRKKRKVILEALILQSATNEWIIEEFILRQNGFSLVNFDSCRMNLKVDF